MLKCFDCIYYGYTGGMLPNLFGSKGCKLKPNVTCDCNQYVSKIKSVDELVKEYI